MEISSVNCQLRVLARTRPITLVYSAHDEVHNDAVALRDFLLGRTMKTAVKIVCANHNIPPLQDY